MRAADILQAAEKAVTHDRHVTYGEARDNMRLVANLWSAYLRCTITPEQVPILLALMKIARTQGGHGTDDNFIDLAGYAAIAGQLRGED
jgi:hypothetical protein|tara:strand:+ start:141 stop:407 length:267 start_codon:yes stop_codon:yes gene_type:complete